MKRSPTGFVAICQCSKIVGALDYARTDHHEAGAILCRWLRDGCTVMPHFTSQWSATVEACQCSKEKEVTAEYNGVRCQCLQTGCRAGPGCPLYTKHCARHIAFSAAQAKEGA